MRLAAIVASALAALVLVGMRAEPVAADCVGPTIEHTTGTLGRGETLRIEGSWWGRFGGPRERSQTAPLEDIAIMVVQGGVEHPVATVTAEEDLTFVVEVPLPADLEPGLADVRAGSPLNPRSHDASDVRLIVSDAPPVTPTTTTQPPASPSTTMAPASASASAPAEEPREPDAAPHPLGVALVVAVVAALVITVALLLSRQTTRG